MIRKAAAIPRIVLRRLPEDVSQAVCHINSLLGINHLSEVEPGELCGMSRMFDHAVNTLVEMKAGAEPEAAAPAAQRAGVFFSPRPIFLR
jgi:hypothetical protein